MPHITDKAPDQSQASKDRAPDRRNRRTRALLKKLMIQALRQMPLQRISVTKLCEAADINRSTFYQHYTDIYALLRDIEEDLLTETDRLCKRILQASLTPEAVMEQIFLYIHENRDLLSLLLFRSDHQGFQKGLNEKNLSLFREKVLQSYRIPEGVLEESLTDTLLFLSAGFYSIYVRWLTNGCQEDLSSLTKCALRLSEACLGTMLQKKEGCDAQ